MQVRQALMASLGKGFKGATDPQVLSMDAAESGYLSGDVTVELMEVRLKVYGQALLFPTQIKSESALVSTAAVTNSVGALLRSD